jgi:hypothetical protein
MRRTSSLAASRRRLLVLIVFPTFAWAAPVANAQTPPTSGVELSVHAGGSRVGAVEGGHLGFLVGARAMLVERNGLRFGGTFDVLPRDRWTGYLFSLGVERAFFVSGPVRPFFGIGIGGMGVDADAGFPDDPRGMSLLVPLVAGIGWPGPEGARWRVRTEARNDIVVRDAVPLDGATPLSGDAASPAAENEGGADHGWGFSVGVSWLFGGSNGP